MTTEVQAYHIERQLNLNEVRSKFTNYTLVKREHSFLLYHAKDHSYFYIKDYGSVVFISFDDVDILSILHQIEEGLKISQLPQETYTIKSAANIDVDFDTIQVPELNTDIAHIIMLNLAQSVALMNYVNKTSLLYEQTLVYTKQLEQKGRFKLSKVNMRKFIGKTLNLKNSISENLFVFDSPDLAWSSKTLSELDYKLKDELDIIKRHQGINNSLNTIKESLDLFSDILHHRYSSMLEWIIIILILFEVLQVIAEKLM